VVKATQLTHNGPRAASFKVEHLVAQKVDIFGLCNRAPALSRSAVHGVGNEATRVHQADRRRGGMAACDAGATRNGAEQLAPLDDAWDHRKYFKHVARIKSSFAITERGI
jgi:hypothetical protein